MSPKKYRGALIGCGYASWFQLTAWANIGGVEIVAVANRTVERAEQRAEQFQIPNYYQDWRAMLNAEEIDFVDIATPPSTHLEMVRESAQRGLDVLCQKPIAATLAELREMIQICQEAGVRFMVNENGRFQPWFRKIKTLLESGVIGAPFYAGFKCRARMTLPEMNAGQQTTLFQTMPRLVIYELGLHYFDTLRYLFGEANTLFTHARKISPHTAGEDVAQIMTRFGDVNTVMDLSWASLPTSASSKNTSWGEYIIEGEKGTLHVQLDGLLRVLTDDNEEQFQYPENSEVLGYQAAQQHFVDCLRSGEEFEVSGPETLKSMELVFGAYDSAAHERIYHIGDDVNRLE